MRLSLLIVTLGVGPLSSQTQFDLAVVKPMAAYEMGRYTRATPGGRVLWHNRTLQELVIEGYGVLPFQVTGGAGWVRSTRWDIEAKVDNFAGTLNKDQLRPLLRHLLEDRFHLKARREDRTGDYFELTTTPGGARIREGNGINWTPKLSSGHPLPPTPPPPPWMPPTTKSDGGGAGSSSGYFYFRGAQIGALVTFLTMRLERIVVDHTGLAGRYQDLLEFSSDTPEPESKPSLFQALREEWGLQLTKRKGPVPHVIIDQASQPTGN